MNEIDIEGIIEHCMKYGNVEVCKAGKVFTLLIVGEGLARATNVMDIQRTVLQKVSPHYPNIEVTKNSDNFFLYILKA